MRKKLCPLLEGNESFHPYDSGLRSNHSTNGGLTEITEQIRKTYDKGFFDPKQVNMESSE